MAVHDHRRIALQTERRKMEPILLAACTALISSVIGAVVGAVVSKIKTMKQSSDDARAEFAAEFAEVKDMLRQNMLMTCRTTIYSDKFSTDEKLEAYVTYRDVCHGNHQTKRYMDDLVGDDVDEYLAKHPI